MANLKLHDLDPQAVRQLRDAVRAVEERPETFGVLSTGERLAVALVLDRFDLLDGYGMLWAVDRIGDDWHRAAMYLHAQGPVERLRDPGDGP